MIAVSTSHVVNLKSEKPKFQKFNSKNDSFLVYMNPFRIDFGGNLKNLFELISNHSDFKFERSNFNENLDTKEFKDSLEKAHKYVVLNPSNSFIGCFRPCFSPSSTSMELMYRAKLKSQLNKNCIVVELLGVAQNTHIDRDSLGFYHEEEVTQPYIDSNSLSCREKEVLSLLSTGKRVKEVASFLFLSTYTIESHIQNIYKKLNISTMVELGKMAERLGVT